MNLARRARKSILKSESRGEKSSVIKKQKQLRIFWDASKQELGAVLQQKEDTGSQFRPRHDF